MAKKLHYVFAVLLSAFALSASAQDTVEKVAFAEDFSKLTTGSVEAPDLETAIVENGTIKPEYTAQEGWTVETAYSAGGAIYVPAKTFLSSPKVNLSASVDQKYVLTCEVYSDSEDGDYLSTIKPDGSAKSVILDAKVWTPVSFEITDIPGTGYVTIQLRTVFSPFAVRNLKVTINAKAQEGGDDPTEPINFLGHYTFKSEKTVLSDAAAWGKWAKSEFTFAVRKNHGADAEEFPYLVGGLPGFDDLKNNDLKAYTSQDGRSLIIPTRDNNKLRTGQQHYEIADGTGAKTSAATIAITKAEDGTYTIEGGMTLVMHTEAFLWFSEEIYDAAKFDNIVIEKAPAADFSGKYTFASTKSVLTNKAAWGEWAKDNFTFKVKTNTGDDAQEYPYIISGFPGITDITTLSLKAYVGDDGMSLVIPTRDANKISKGSQHYEISDSTGQASTADAIVIAETDFGKYTIREGMTLIMHTEAFLWFSEEVYDAAKYEDITIDKAPATDFAGMYHFQGTKTIVEEVATWGAWALEDFYFNITANEGDDAQEYPYLVEKLFAYSNGTISCDPLKAYVSADGCNLILPTRDANKFKSGSQHYEMADSTGYATTASVITIAENDDMTTYSIPEGLMLVMHTEAFLWFSEELHNAAKFDNITITKLTQDEIDAVRSIQAKDIEEPVAPVAGRIVTGVYNMNGTRVRANNSIEGLAPGMYIVGGKKVIVRK